MKTLFRAIALFAAFGLSLGISNVHAAGNLNKCMDALATLNEASDELETKHKSLQKTLKKLVELAETMEGSEEGQDEYDSALKKFEPLHGAGEKLLVSIDTLEKVIDNAKKLMKQHCEVW